MNFIKHIIRFLKEICFGKICVFKYFILFILTVTLVGAILGLIVGAGMFLLHRCTGWNIEVCKIVMTLFLCLVVACSFGYSHLKMAWKKTKYSLGEQG